MPTICLDCRYLNPRPSGIAELVRALVEHLPILAPDWHFKLLRHPAAERPLSDALNVTEVEVRAEPNGPVSMWFLPQIVDLGGVDLFHAPSNILPRGLTMPCVTTIHDVMWLTHPELCHPVSWGRIERLFFQHGINRALRESDSILTVSQATRGAILELHPELSDRTDAILSGVSQTFQPSVVDQSELGRLGLPKTPYVLTIGQNAPYKNHQGAIRGFAKAFGDSPEIEMVIVQRRGAGADRLRRLVNQLGLRERVHFLPPLKDQDMATLYSGALVLLHPSIIEGFGMPLAEAMACGCPVICSDHSAMPEVTGGAALLVDPQSTDSIAAGLRRIVEQPGLADDLRQSGQKRAAELDWRICAAGYLDTYRDVLRLN